MAGSVAEERIRAKVEARLRAEFPDARIIHELNVEQLGIRLDLAAVRPGAITLVEIKSERDVLKRLKSQLQAALKITGDVRVYLAEKHRAAITAAEDSYLRGPDGKHVKEEVPSKRGQAWRFLANPDHVAELLRVRVLFETDTGFDPHRDMHSSWWPRQVLEHVADPRAQLEMLWAEELRATLANVLIGAPPRASRGVCKRLALEHMTGRQIRMAVCAALRSRPFARADAEAA